MQHTDFPMHTTIESHENFALTSPFQAAAPTLHSQKTGVTECYV